MKDTTESGVEEGSVPVARTGRCRAGAAGNRPCANRGNGSVVGEGCGCAGAVKPPHPRSCVHEQRSYVHDSFSNVARERSRGSLVGGERTRPGETHGRIEGRLSARLSNATLGKELCSKQGACRWIHADARGLSESDGLRSGETGPFRRRRDVPERLRGFRGMGA